MSHVTRVAAEEMLGILDENVFAAIEATGASLADIAGAKSLADATSVIAGQGERALTVPTKEVSTILSRRHT
ncbi:MAG: hypothetical protein ACSHXW_20400 [Yoonia sp.]